MIGRISQSGHYARPTMRSDANPRCVGIDFDLSCPVAIVTAGNDQGRRARPNEAGLRFFSVLSYDTRNLLTDSLSGDSQIVEFCDPAQLSNHTREFKLLCVRYLTQGKRDYP